MRLLGFAATACILLAQEPVWHGVRLAKVIAYAYRIEHPAYELDGDFEDPKWLASVDIDLQVAPESGEDGRRAAMQKVLEQRFGIRVHREKREITHYSIVIGKKGSRLQASDPNRRVGLAGYRAVESGHAELAEDKNARHLIGKGATVAQIAEALSAQLHAPVQDATGLQGTFDFDVPYVPEDGPKYGRPGRSLDTGLQDDLGLRLEKTKIRLEVLVVDRIHL